MTVQELPKARNPDLRASLAAMQHAVELARIDTHAQPLAVHG